MGIFSFFTSRIKGGARRTKNYASKITGAEEIQAHHRDIKETAANIFRRPKTRREETFENAYARLGLSEERLKESHKYYKMRFYVFYACCMVTLLVVGWMLFTTNWTGLGAGIGGLAVLGALLFDSSLRLYQIQHRALVDAGTWMRDPGGWFPGDICPPRAARSDLENPTLREKGLVRYDGQEF